MLRLTHVVETPEPPLAGVPRAILTLSFEDRRRSRLLARLGDGSEVALLLPRGTQLRDGTWLGAEDGAFLVQVRAAAESLSVAATGDRHLLARAAYHLGNRHVPLQIGEGWVAYQHDHVLDDLARSLGLVVTIRSAAFEPEGGGYTHHSDDHSQGHDHAHAHADAHSHSHSHSHAHAHAHGDRADAPDDVPVSVAHSHERPRR